MKRDFLSTNRAPRETLTLRQQQALDRREQILETALRLFAQHGFDGTSTKRIAEAAGITEGLIFHYFPTKADLLNAVLETRHSFIGELRALLDGAEAETATDVLQHLAISWLETLRREKEITLVFFNTALTNEKVGETLRALIAEGITRLSAYLKARVKAGELRADLPVESSARMFFSPLIIFFIVNHSLGEAEWKRRAITFVHETLSVWLDGARV